jgi:biopolymer transport protein ExbD
MSIKNSRKQRKANKGITLIALVITIIVLLILAAVSIATLTGENGILSKANTAKTETEKAGAKEKVQMAVMSSFDDSGKLDYEQLKTNLDKVEGIDKETVPSPTITELPIKVKVDGYDVKIDENGKVTVKGESIGGNPTPNPPTLPTVEEVKEIGTVLDENNPTTITDTYGNEVKVPEGFKIAEDSAIDVTGGVVIEDVSHGATAGSQFVWIPVGTVYTSADKSTSKTIELNRYTFDESGNPTPQGEKVIDTYYQELATSDKGNTVAKDIEVFKTSATKNKGYYIGRYEARSVIQRTDSSNPLAQVTVKPNDYVYNYVTQPQAAALARGMYGEDKKFTSDLINSYAWDTAIVFLQTFDNRTDKTKPYSRQTSLSSSLAPQGTNNLTDLTKQDKICNIWDMASNNYEKTTETTSNSGHPCSDRGTSYSSSIGYTSSRSYNDISSASRIGTFRLTLYL